MIDQAATRARHVAGAPRGIAMLTISPPYCVACNVPWPCDASRFETALRDLFLGNRSLWAHLHVRHACEHYDPDSGGLPEAHAAMKLLRELGEDPR